MSTLRFGLQFEFDDDVLEELLFLAKHAARIEEAANLAGKVPFGTDFAETAQIVSRKLGLPAGDVERLLATVHNILRTEIRMRVDTPRFLEAVTQAFETKADDQHGQENLRAWKEAAGNIREQLGKISPDHPFSVARKAERLSRSHERILNDVKIITDLRPVFSGAGDKVLQSLVTHTLLIEYFDGSRNSRIELGLEASDLAELRKACERAELKAITLKGALKGLPWAALLPPADRSN